jgi:adenine deaminase
MVTDHLRSPTRALAAVVCLWAARAAGAQDADLIVRNARIWTGDSVRPYAEAVAIRGDRFVAVGTAAAVAPATTITLSSP